MLQNARSNNSKSFLREAEYALALIENEKDREYFLKKIKKVFENRKNPNIHQTGEKELKTELLAYLKQFDEVKTANIWCRNLDIDKKKINDLLLELQIELSKYGIQGILEIHLQDREINSPHIQFVGNKAEIAEYLIAGILVKNGYENSISSAIGKKEDFKPHYNLDPRARTSKLEDSLKYYERIERSKEKENSIDILLEKLDEKIKENKTQIQKLKEKRLKMREKLDSIDEYRLEIRNKMSFLRKIRLKIKV